MNILKAEKLCKVYGKGQSAINALNSVDLEINKGEFIAITGPSGSGKSTLLHLLGGLDYPSSGTVILEGANLYSLPDDELSILRRRKFGFVFQFFNLIPILSVEENITLPLLLDNKPVDREYIGQLILLLGLSDKRNSLPSELSGGQQQRVSIARALANKPSLVFADEPTGNLDIKTGKEVLNLLKITIKKYHQTLVMVTHDQQAAAGADRIIRVEDGNIIERQEVAK